MWAAASLSTRCVLWRGLWDGRTFRHICHVFHAATSPSPHAPHARPPSFLPAHPIAGVASPVLFTSLGLCVGVRVVVLWSRYARVGLVRLMSEASNLVGPMVLHAIIDTVHHWDTQAGSSWWHVFGFGLLLYVCAAMPSWVSCDRPTVAT